jgi:hypothetical protein
MWGALSDERSGLSPGRIVADAQAQEYSAQLLRLRRTASTARLA